jgi:FKBP-type peptidyl-prolyl cis-trans isomerase FkpA
MRIANVLLGLLVLLCVACKSEKETPSGLKFKVVKEGTGKPSKPGDVLVFNFKLVDSKDSVWSDTYKEGMPGAILIQDSAVIAQEDGLMQMLRMVVPGDSVTVAFTMKEFFEVLAKRPIPPTVDSTLSLTYRFKIDSITTREAIMAFQAKAQGEIMMKRYAEILENSKEQLEKDFAIIDAYLAEKKITAEKSALGVRYVISQPGTGENAKAGQTVSVQYSGYLLDGKLFDTSVKEIAMKMGTYQPMREPYEPYDVTINQTSVILGWHEALKHLNKGAKATVYIPSSMGYGVQGNGQMIGPNSVLVFELEIVELK